MSLRLAGLGWVTPLGRTIDEVWAKLLTGAEAEGAIFDDSLGGKSHAFPVPPAAIAEASRHRRLRRASAISRFAVLAGLDALRDGALDLDEVSAARTALVFAISNGGVIYTRRFFHDIVTSGASAASPLLFPETVFNAPASHLAAILGITGVSYTLVGDGAVGILALKMAEDLMADPDLDRCLVVGAEETDWLLCEAYRKWRLLRPEPPIEPFARPPKGMILSEGAGAVLLARKGDLALEHIHAGGNFAKQSELVRQLDMICGSFPGKKAVDILIASANGTFVDEAECAAAAKHFPTATLYTVKPALGESVAAGGLWQLICAAQALRAQMLPPILHAPADSGLTTVRSSAEQAWRRAVVITCGLNQQMAALTLRL
jgi:3-oxoacyl-(acyl-carrier-protein) synthase